MPNLAAVYAKRVWASIGGGGGGGGPKMGDARPCPLRWGRVWPVVTWRTDRRTDTARRQRQRSAERRAGNNIALYVHCTLTRDKQFWRPTVNQFAKFVSAWRKLSASKYRNFEIYSHDISLLTTSLISWSFDNRRHRTL